VSRVEAVPFGKISTLASCSSISNDLEYRFRWYHFNCIFLSPRGEVHVKLSLDKFMYRSTNDTQPSISPEMLILELLLECQMLRHTEEASSNSHYETWKAHTLPIEIEVRSLVFPS
jgi:hypothetical protein